jgi:UDP-glucose 4-epimerase
VRRLVVKSSQAVYGSRSDYPSLLAEEAAGASGVGSPVSRDLVELEQLTNDFAARNPACRVARLRLGYRISRQTALGRYLSLPLVPTFAGFDPRLQFLHDDDAAAAVAAAVLGTQEGPFNVAGDGIVLLSQALGIMAGRGAPILPPVGYWLGRLAIRSTTGVDLPPHVVELLMHGSVVDCSRLQTEFGWKPAYSSMAVMDAFAQGLTEEPIESPSPPQEYELQVYLQRRRRGEANGRGSHLALKP